MTVPKTMNQTRDLKVEGQFFQTYKQYGGDPRDNLHHNQLLVD